METNIENATRRILRHIYKQPYRCADGHKCLYRRFLVGKVDKCFVGALMPDEQYYPGLDEMGNIAQISIRLRLNSLQELLDLPNPVSDKDLDFLREIQTVHDTQSPDRWVPMILSLKERYISTPNY